MKILPMEIRRIIVQEIKAWEEEGILPAATAKVLRERYDFDFPKPAPPPPVPAPMPVRPVPAPAPVPPPPAPKPRPVVPAAPRASLMEILLSEAAIKTALYLGAFFVIAAALILAALVETARLPVLLAVTLLFGGAALALRKRLPLPSYILYMVFSALLPIDAGVFANLIWVGPSREVSSFWTVTLFGMALLWAWSTWLLQSRVFSVVSFGALALSAWFLANVFGVEASGYVALLTAASLPGMLGAFLLKRWKGQGFIQPLYWILQVYQAGLLFLSLSIVLAGMLNAFASVDWPSAAFTWGLAAVFYVLSDVVLPLPLPLFAWMAVAALSPVLWLGLNRFAPSNAIYAVGLWGWGLLLAVGGEITDLEKTRPAKKYALPLSLASLAMFSIGSFWGFVESQSLGFALCVASGLALTAMNIRRIRWWVWSFGLLAWLTAYISFFGLPFIHFAPEALYALTGAVTLLLLPDLFLSPSFRDQAGWRWPPRIFNILLVGFTTLVALFDNTPPDHAAKVALVFGVFALLGLAFALRFRRPALGLLFTCFAPLAVIYAADIVKSDPWLPALTGLVGIFYALGLVLAWRKADPGWARLFRWSALALGALVSAAAFGWTGQGTGWYVAAIGCLYMIETFAYLAQLEVFVYLFLGLAYNLIATALGASFSYHWMGSSLLVLGLDLLFRHFLKTKRPLAPLVRAAGGILTAVATLAAVAAGEPQPATLMFAVFALFFLALAIYYRRPLVGALFSAYLLLAVLYALQVSNSAEKLPATVVLSVLYFGAGLALGRTKLSAGWANLLRWSGLATGAVAGALAPSYHGPSAGWYIAVIAILFVLESFKDSRFEIGAPVFFSLAFWLLAAEYRLEPLALELAGLGLIWLALDLLFAKTLTARPWKLPARGVAGVLVALTTINLLFTEAPPGVGSLAAGGFALAFLLMALLYGRPRLGYLATAYAALALFFGTDLIAPGHWLELMLALAVVYYAAGLALTRAQRGQGWDRILRDSGLAAGALIVWGGLLQSGWVAPVVAAIVTALFVVEVLVQKTAWLEFAIDVFATLAYFLILRELHVTTAALYVLGASLVPPSVELAFRYLLKLPRAWDRLPSMAGAIIGVLNAAFVLVYSITPNNAALVFGVYAVYALAYALIIRKPEIGYVFTGLAPISVYFFLTGLGTTQWSFPIIGLAALYYLAGFGLTWRQRAPGWQPVLIRSGLLLGTWTALWSPTQHAGLAGSIPVAVAATLWAAEAFRRRNVWLGFPANALYLMAYFMLLLEIKVDQPQFFTVGAAMLGILMHYLLMRSGSRTAAFITGTLSQLVLLSTTLYQMWSAQQLSLGLSFFIVLFFESLAVLAYGLVIRSRSLVGTPIVFVVIGVILAVLGALKGISLVILIGLAGIVLLTLAILALLLRERIAGISQQLTSWNA